MKKETNKNNENEDRMKRFFWDKIDVAEIIFDEFYRQSQLDEKLRALDSKLNKTLKGEDLELFRKFEVKVVEFYTQEKRDLIKFVLNFIKECKI